VTAWTNISDQLDFVAAVKHLKPLFGQRVEDHLINNGVAAHRVTHYLTAVETGRAIIAGLTGG
jgi:hypothetical protein